MVSKENMVGNKSPLFLRFIAREAGVRDLLQSFSKSSDSFTAGIAQKAMENPPDLDEFRKELEDAVRDVIKDGPSDEFKAFVNHYMSDSLVEEMSVRAGAMGENRSQIAVVRDENTPWVQGLVCYNLCLYIKAFGLDELKACRVCGKLFANKGKYAVYCGDSCKKKKVSDKEKNSGSEENR